MNRPTRHVGPTASEQALFAIWDRVNEARQRGGEPAARALAEQALKAIEAPAQPARKEPNQDEQADSQALRLR
jgi:hypothetical protein